VVIYQLITAAMHCHLRKEKTTSRQPKTVLPAAKNQDRKSSKHLCSSKQPFSSTVGRRGVENLAVVSIYIHKQPLKKILPSRGFPAVVLYLLPDHITPTTMVVLLMAINLMTAFTLTWGSLLFNE